MLLAIEWKNQRKICMNQKGKNNCRSQKKYLSLIKAIRFFYDFRCGILHQAEVMGSSLLWSVGLLICKKSNGTSYLNRTKFHEYLKNDIILYTENLKNPLNKELRKNFIIKMNYISRKID